jgi:hypothetical protein
MTYWDGLRDDDDICQHNTLNLCGVMKEAEKRVENFMNLRRWAKIIEYTGHCKDNLETLRQLYEKEETTHRRIPRLEEGF